MTPPPLWTVDAMARAMRAERAGALPASISGISIDTRTIAAGEAFFAIRGDNRDGHEFVPPRSRPVPASRWWPPTSARALPRTRRCLSCRRARRTTRARAGGAYPHGGEDRRSHRLGRQDRHQGGTASGARRQGETHASAASYNNHWGVPLSLARCPQSARYAVLEIGMNHAGEIEPLTRLVRPQVAIITTIESVHLEFFGSVDAIADAKAEIFLGLEGGGAAVINRDNPQFARLPTSAMHAGVGRGVRFGEHAEAEARLLKCALHADCSTVEARILGANVTYKVGAPGRHVVLNSLAVLAASTLVGADLALVALALAQLQPATGRGSRMTLELPGGSALLIDESYNANPASMRGGARAARTVAGGAARPAHRGARRHARARAARRRSPSRAWRACGRARCRSGLLLWAADARPVGGSSLPAAEAAIPRPPPHSSRTCSPPSDRATPS